MKIRCLIERDGVTTVMYAGKRFDFILNEHGHSVCEVSNPGAADYFLKTLAGNFYEKYESPAEEQCEDATGKEPATTQNVKIKSASGARARGNRSKKKKTESTEE